MNIKSSLMSKITEVLTDLGPKQAESAKAVAVEEQMEFLFEVNSRLSEGVTSPSRPL